MKDCEFMRQIEKHIASSREKYGPKKGKKRERNYRTSRGLEDLIALNHATRKESLT